MDLDQLILAAGRARGRFKGLTPMYYNDPAIDDLLRWTMGFAELQTTIEQASEHSLTASAEVGVDTGPIVSWFVKLKAAVSGSATLSDAVRTVASADNRLELLAVAEAVLEQNGNLTRDPSEINPREFFHLRNAFHTFAPGQENELLARLGPEYGPPIIDRWKIDTNMSDSQQFVYATREPHPIAAVLTVPTPGGPIGGDSFAAYPSGQNRLCFGRWGAVWHGVRFVNTMYYVADGDVVDEERTGDASA